ncbi:hypothetical protein T06_7154 [Trichinella sp. T6]|nr:hypothetical protein T06_7154 [Trichinella sp. T6]
MKLNSTLVLVLYASNREQREYANFYLPWGIS